MSIEHRRKSALLRNSRNIRIYLGKKPIVSVTNENERISIKNSLTYLKCESRLSCVAHGPIYSRFMGFFVNGFLSIYKSGLPGRPYAYRENRFQVQFLDTFLYADNEFYSEICLTVNSRLLV